MPEEDRQQLDFDVLAQSLRTKLHRYCARMAGSSIDGEDIVQDALLKAMQAFAGTGLIADPEAWLFRIAHNTALDFLRRRVRLQALVTGEPAETIADPTDEIARHQVAAMGLRPFMKLSPAERSSVILMDVIGYSLREVGTIMETTVPAVKASLHRGRARLTALTGDADDVEIELSEQESERLLYYVERFNARDFDAVRDLLAEDVRLDLVNRMTMRGKTEVARYFGNYGSRFDWVFAVGAVEGRAAILSRRPGDRAGLAHNFILLDWDGDQIARIRDFYYAGHVLQAASIGLGSNPDPV